MKTDSPLILRITPEEEGQRLDKYLSGLDEISSRNYAKRLIDDGRVRINGKPAKPSQTLVSGAAVEIDLPAVQPTDLQPYDFPLDIVFEDRDILVVNKPSGLVVHPAAGHQQDTLVNALLFHTRELSMKNEIRPGIVHRIDKETSGLLVVARNDRAHDDLARQFKEKSMHRMYYALAQGTLGRSEGVCRSYLARHPSDRKRFASVRVQNRIVASPPGEPAAAEPAGTEPPGGKWAVTHFQRLALAGGMSYLRLRLETGRTHQIRVHMSELGHPLVGDTLYGFPTSRQKELGLTRFFLHAAELGFTHPLTGKALRFQAPWPQVDYVKLKEFGFEPDAFSK